jgi:hypothetical protein
MGIKETWVLFRHDEGYGDDFLRHVNVAVRGRDMEAVGSCPAGHHDDDRLRELAQRVEYLETFLGTFPHFEARLKDG